MELIKKGLLSNNYNEIIKSLAIISKTQNSDYFDDVKKLLNHENEKIRTLASTVLSLIKNKQNTIKITSLSSFIKKYNSLSNESSKIKIIKILNNYNLSLEDKEKIEEMVILVLNEPQNNVSYKLSKVIIKWFGEDIIPFIIKHLNYKNKKYYTNIVIILNKLDTKKGFNKILDIYENSSDLDFIFFASCYIWKYSKLVVIAKMKYLVQGDLHERIIAAKLCTVFAHNKIKGIINHLLFDSSEAVRNRAQIALQNLEKKINHPDTLISYSKHLSENFLIKFEKIIKTSDDFYEKLMVMNILYNLGQKSFLGLIKNELSNEKNPFLISSYVKFIGRYDEENCIDLLLPYLKYNDNRVVANCIEGLAFQKRNDDLISEFKNFLKNKDHRISTMSALALWNNNEKHEVMDYIHQGVGSKKLWKRKACLHIMSFIKSPEFYEETEKLINDSCKDIKEQSKALLKIYQHFKAIGKENNDNIIDYIIENKKVPEKYVNNLIKTIKDTNLDISQRIKAAQRITYIATDDDFKVLYKCFQGSSNILLKAELAKSIGIIFSKGDEFLFDILKKDLEPEIISSAIEALSYYDIKDRIDEIIPFLYSENVLIVSKSAVLLYDIMPNIIMEKLSNMMNSNETDIRKSCLSSLKALKNPQSYMMIRELIADEDYDIALAASKILSDFDSDKTLVSEAEKLINTNKIESSSKEYLLNDILEEIESYDNISDDIVSKITQLLNEDNILYFISFFDKCDNENLIEKLSPLFSEFSTNKNVIEYLKNYFNNEISNKLINIMKYLNNPILFDEIVEKLDTDKYESQLFLLKLFFENSVYGNEFYKLIIKKDKRIHSLVNIFSSNEQKDERMIEDDFKINSKENIIAKSENVTKVQKRQKVVSNNPYKILNSILFNAKKYLYISGVILLVIFSILFLYVFILKKNKIPNSIKKNSEMKKSQLDINKKNTNNDVLQSEEKLKEFYNDWQKYYNKKYTSNEKRLVLLELVQDIEKYYNHGEFYRCKKMIQENLFGGANIEVDIVIDNIKNKKHIVNFKTGLWKK